MQLKSYLIIITVLSISGFSCVSKAVCKENCYPLTISGVVMNGATNTPASGLRMIVDWELKKFISTTRRITKFRSGKDGTFNTTVDIDTSMFHQEYDIILELLENDRYIVSPRSYYNPRGTFSPDMLSSMQLTVYPRASLTINLNRTQNDDFEYVWIEYSFDNQTLGQPVRFSGPADIDQKVWEVATSAEIFTKVTVTKLLKNDTAQIITVDSIQCNKRNNSITVNF